MIDLDKANSKFNEIMTFLQSEEGKIASDKYFGELARSEAREDYYVDEFNNYLETLSNNDLNKLFEKFIKWERKYGEMWYNRGVEADSNIINIIWNVFIKYGTQIKSDEYFCTATHKYRGYVMSLFVGQGSFFSITYEVSYKN